MKNLPEGLTMIAKVEGRDLDSGPIKVDFEIEGQFLTLTFHNSDSSISFDVAAVAAALEKLEFDFAAHKRQPQTLED